MPNILYAYDEDNGSFSALPASPWLLPAIAIAAAGAAIQSCQPKEIILGDAPKVDPIEYEHNRTRWHFLIDKGMANWSDDDYTEYYKLSYPSWHPKGGPPRGY